MKVQETHYLSVSNDDNTNYYRVRVTAHTSLGEAEYRSGWFPTSSLDMLFGNVTSSGGLEAMKVREEVKSQINEKILFTNKAWLDEAANLSPDITRLQNLLDARRRILAYPVGSPFSGSMQMEYNPVLGLAINHSDEKLVFFLSSNPDEVIGKIANFSEDDKTVLALDKLTEITSQRYRNNITSQQAVEVVNKRIDTLVHNQITTVLELTAKPAPKKEEVLQQINTLIDLLEEIQK
jgi:hypothetical protein